MTRRPAVLAGSWYPGDEPRCAEAIRRLLDDTKTVPVEGEILGGLVPHAGWDFSGATAAATFRALRDEREDRTIVLLGAVHRKPLPRPALSLDEAWETPVGDLPVDRELARDILEGCDNLVDEDADAHPAGENSIELQTALIRGILPEARFVPIQVPPAESALEFGVALGRVLAARASDVAVVASTDLTHYGYGGWAPAGRGADAVRWVKEVNDRRFLDLVCDLRAEEMVEESRTHRNACGAGAAAAAVAVARARGVEEGVLLGHTTSYDVQPTTGADRFVGYASVVFPREQPQR